MVFALRRQILGRILHKKVPVSAIGVFSYDGAQVTYRDDCKDVDDKNDVKQGCWNQEF